MGFLTESARDVGYGAEDIVEAALLENVLLGSSSRVRDRHLWFLALLLALPFVGLRCRPPRPAGISEHHLLTLGHRYDG